MICSSELVVRDEWHLDTIFEINRHGKYCAYPGYRTSDLWNTNTVLSTDRAKRAGHSDRLIV